VTMTEPDLDSLLAFAESLADAARPVSLSYFRRPLTVDMKADDSPVTVADRTVEATLRRMIAERYPDHAVYGEEMGHTVGDVFTWVVDPIDGTKSFITGSPLWGTLIALAVRGRPTLGVVDCPVPGDRWTAANGRTLHNGAPARTSDRRVLSEAFFYTTSPDAFAEEDLGRLERVSRAARLRRFGGDCHSYGLLASGHVDVIVEAGLQPYDYMSLVPVIEGAGGVITDWRGGALGFDSDGRVVAAATPELHRACLDLLA